MNQKNKDGIIGELHRRFLDKHELPSTFCFAPYVNVDLDQSGNIRPCFRSSDQGLGDWKTKNIIDEYNNEFKDLRKKLFTGKQHHNCSQCYSREMADLLILRKFTETVRTSGIDVNKMVSDIKENPYSLDPENLLSVEIRVSNICNLECINRVS